MCHCSAAYCCLWLSVLQEDLGTVFMAPSPCISFHLGQTLKFGQSPELLSPHRGHRVDPVFFLQYLGSFPPSKSGMQWEGCQRGAGRQEAMQTPDIWSLKLSDNKSALRNCGSTLQLHFLMLPWNRVRLWDGWIAAISSLNSRRFRL